MLNTIKRIIHDLMLLVLVGALVIIGEFVITTIQRRLNDHV